MTYECKRCFSYTTKFKNDMERHLNRKVKCNRILESYKYGDEYKESSFIKIMPEINIIDAKNLDEILIYISAKKEKKCLFCDISFTRVNDLKKHIQKYCKKINLNKFNNTTNEELNNIQNNTQNNTQNINIQNIQNITINVYNGDTKNDSNKIIIIPFDQKWNTDELTDSKKLKLLLSDSKYTSTMKELLNNDKNMNIIFDKDNDSGLIYKNDDEKFINMKTTEIIDKAMYKIYDHLTDFWNEISNENNITNALEPHKKIIDKKYKNFEEDKDKKTKEFVKNVMVDIFDKNKDKVIERFIE